MERIVNQRLTKTESEVIKVLVQSGKELFTTADINTFVYQEAGSTEQVYKLLAGLKAKGWIERIESGKYALLNITGDVHRNSYLVAMKLVEPACIAYWSALNYYGLTEQLPITVFVQTTKRKASKNALGVQYKFITIRPFKFFGTRKEWLRKGEARHLYFTISDLEKTVVDCFDYPEYSGGIVECAKGLVNAANLKDASKLDVEKMFRYAEAMKNSAIIKRIGFIADLFGLTEIREMAEQRRGIFSPKISLLDTTSGNKGRYTRKWMLRININEEQLKHVFET